jgi:hypothetical protein
MGAKENAFMTSASIEQPERTPFSASPVNSVITATSAREDNTIDGAAFIRDDRRLRPTPVSEPGCYLCQWNGRLLRVCAEELTSGTFDIPDFDPNRPSLVTKLHADPYITLRKARIIAANWDLVVESAG